MSQPGRMPPLMETRKVLGAARPPVGEGPPVGEVLAGMRRLRPPSPVLAAVALMALVPAALLALAVAALVWTWTSDGVALALVKTVLFAGTLLLLAGLCWRGVKRALHVGSYAEGLFAARLVLLANGAFLLFLLWYVQRQDGELSASMLVFPAALVLAWLPVLPLRARAATEWPDRVLLRRGPSVRSRRELAMLLTARPHTCGQPLPVDGMAEVRDDEGRGWAWSGPCPSCGQDTLQVARLREADAADPADPWAWGRAGSRPALGGGDLLYLGDRLAAAAEGDPGTWSVEQLQAGQALLADAVQATEQLLSLVPAGKAAVPFRQRWGRPPGVGDPDAFSRVRLEARLAERRGRLAAVGAELARRA